MKIDLHSEIGNPKVPGIMPQSGADHPLKQTFGNKIMEG